MPTLRYETLSGPKTNILLLSIASWLFYCVFPILSVNVNIGFKGTSICHVQWWEELLFLSHKSKKALKSHRSLVLYYWFCASLLVLLLRVWTINLPWLLHLPKFPNPQTVLPFLKHPCLELHWCPCCGSGCVPVKPSRLLGGSDLPDHHLPVPQTLVLEVLSFTPAADKHRSDIWYTELLLAGELMTKLRSQLLTTTVEQSPHYSLLCFNFLIASMRELCALLNQMP